MKAIKTKVNNLFTVDWKNIKNVKLYESKRVYSIHDYDEDSILFI
jgi:hypothetical protein